LFTNSKPSAKEGKQRNLFASAITPGGFKNYLETVLVTEKVFVIKGVPGTGTEKLLEKVRTAAVERGYFVESYYCALIPSKLEHLVIPEIGVSFTTANRYHNASVNAYITVDLNEYLDKTVLEKYAESLEYNESEFTALKNKDVETIGKAKLLHDQMEKYYIPNMDFDAVQRCREATLSRILSYAGVK
jgi:hypothetical protein